MSSQRGSWVSGTPMAETRSMMPQLSSVRLAPVPGCTGCEALRACRVYPAYNPRYSSRWYGCGFSSAHAATSFRVHVHGVGVEVDPGPESWEGFLVLVLADPGVDPVVPLKWTPQIRLSPSTWPSAISNAPRCRQRP